MNLIGCNFLNNITRFFTKNMKGFRKHFNPMLKTSGWVIMDENYDYKIDIARAAYADMLHDKERNQKYFRAIKLAVESIEKQGKISNVLDIGTGTGLLSMMAIEAGANNVTACEAFEPMGKCAKQVIKDNKMDGKIKVVPKHSCDLVVGPGKDLNEKANILVTELFDTELIGEGALHAYQHAVKNLVEEDCICVPHSATVYAQPVYCEMIDNWNTIRPLHLENGTTLQPPQEFQTCPGFPSIHDLQLGQLKESDFIPLSKPVPVFNFVFNNLESLAFKQRTRLELEALNDGKCNGVFMWWDLSMDPGGLIKLSCGPHWANDWSEWRDHWMQAIHYLHVPCHLRKGETFTLESLHDDYCIWFDVTKSPTKSSEIPLRPICECRMHIGLNRNTLAMWNDSSRVQFYSEQVLKKHVTKGASVVLCVGEGSWLPYVAGTLGARQVFYIEGESSKSRLASHIISTNNLQDKVTLIKKDYEEVTAEDFGGAQVDLIVGDMHFLSSVLPWDNLYLWHLSTRLQELGVAHQNTAVLPGQAEVRAVAVSFSNLDKIRAPVISAEGFNLKSFDCLIQQAIEECDEAVEPHNIWEYSSLALTKAFTLATLDMSLFSRSEQLLCQGVEQLSSLDWPCNGLILWLDYRYQDTLLSSGPHSVVPGQTLEWNKYTRPGIYFLKPKECSKELHWNLKFGPKQGLLQVDCRLN